MIDRQVSITLVDIHNKAKAYNNKAKAFTHNKAKGRYIFQEIRGT